MAECGQRVGTGVVTFPCTIEAAHEGPCMAQEIPRTVRARDRWLADKRHAESGLAEFQGRAETTAERYTDPGSALPHPDAAKEVPEPAQAAQEPTKQRPGDQPLPVVNDEVSIQDRVIADIERRKAIGLERYGTLLQPFNGRDVLQDLYEELMDALMYVKQAMVERDAERQIAT